MNRSTLDLRLIAQAVALLALAVLGVMGIFAIPGEWLAPEIARVTGSEGNPFGPTTFPVVAVVSFS